MRRRRFRDRQRSSRMVVQERTYHRLVLFWLQRASGVNDDSTGTKVLKGVFQQSHLEWLELSNLFGSQAPADFRVALQCPRAGTRCVHQNLVKQPEEGERAGCVAGNPAQVLPILGMQTARNLEPVPMKIQSEHRRGTVFQARDLRALASNARTNVKAHVEGCKVQQMRNQLRTCILNCNPLIAKESRFLEVAFDDFKDLIR